MAFGDSTYRVMRMIFCFLWLIALCSIMPHLGCTRSNRGLSSLYFDVDPEGRVVYAYDREEKVFRIEEDGRRVLLGNGKNPSVGPSGAIYAEHNEALILFDREKPPKEVASIPRGFTPVPARDGSKLYFCQWNRIRGTSMGGETYDSFTLMKLLPDGSTAPLDPTVFSNLNIEPNSEDREAIYFMAQIDHSEYGVFAIYKEGERKKILALDGPSSVSVAYKRNLMAYTISPGPGRYGIFLARKDGTDSKQISHEAASQVLLSEDGSELWVSRRLFGEGESDSDYSVTCYDSTNMRVLKSFRVSLATNEGP